MFVLHCERECDIIPHVAVTLMNIHEDKRQTPLAWVTVGMIPFYHPSKDRGDKGGDGNPMRQCEIIQESYDALLENWNDKTREFLNVQWATGGPQFFPTKFLIAAVLADQVECDKIACNSRQCHHCWAVEQDWLKVDYEPRLKTMDEVKQKVLAAANELVVADSSTKKRKLVFGATQAAYERKKKECGGFHLMINAFWKIENFDLHSQMMRCVMHTTDLGVFKQILTGILQTYGQVPFLYTTLLLY